MNVFPPTYRLVFMQNLPISHVWLGPVCSILVITRSEWLAGFQRLDASVMGNYRRTWYSTRHYDYLLTCPTDLSTGSPLSHVLVWSALLMASVKSRVFSDCLLSPFVLLREPNLVDFLDEHAITLWHRRLDTSVKLVKTETMNFILIIIEGKHLPMLCNFSPITA